MSLPTAQPQDISDNAKSPGLLIHTAISIFLGAFLLFLVQPLMGKYILPWFGGSPGVWTTCMLFFQVLLLGGYAYAHLLVRYLTPRQQAIVHALLLVAAVIVLPIGPATSWKPTGSGNEVWRILSLLTVCLGLPYLVLSATGPLLQAWFSRLSGGASPYRLYALSNVGSLLALVIYPFVVEPKLSRTMQATAWSWGMGVFVVACLGCAVRVWLAGGTNTASEAKTDEKGIEERITWGQWAMWLALPACASVLLLATTNKICLDVSVIPFLWIVPLGLYLLSFILCFDSQNWYAREGYAWALLAAVIAASILLSWQRMSFIFQSMLGNELPLKSQVLAYAAILFVCCMVCHGEVALRKPSPRFLTAYYLTIALGGALGGILVALVAPMVFSDYKEMLVGICACAMLAIIAMRTGKEAPLGKLGMTGFWTSITALVVLGGTLWFFGEQSLPRSYRIGQWRNFYGVVTVFEHVGEPEGKFRMLRYGGIMHGLQFMDADRQRWATTYYAPESGGGLAVTKFPRQENRRIGVIGLGIGTMATYAKAGDTIRFYEINPRIPLLATEQFLHLTGCQGQVEVAMGDARLSLEREEAQNFDILVVDAFSGDAIPVHLLTSECFELYLRHCKPDAVLAFHLSNRHLDLVSVVQRLAEQFKMRSVRIDVTKPNPESGATFSCWMLIGRDTAFFDQETIKSVAKPIRANPAVGLWTDETVNLFDVLK